MTGMAPGGDFTGADALILSGIVASGALVPVVYVALSRWLIRMGETRIGLASIQAFKPAPRDVAATEDDLMPAGFDLGRIA